MHQEEKDAAKGQKGAWRSRDGEYARDVVERDCNGRKMGACDSRDRFMLVLQSFCFQHQQSCLRGYKGCLGDILSLSVDQSPLQLCFPALYWARAALRPLITSQRLDLTVSREDGLLCSIPVSMIWYSLNTFPEDWSHCQLRSSPLLMVINPHRYPASSGA